MSSSPLSRVARSLRRQAGSHPARSGGRHRRALLAGALGCALVGQPLLAPPVQAAENLVFVTGAFRRSIPVDDLEHLATTGQARGLLAEVLAFSRQRPEGVAKLLNQSISLPVSLVSRLLHTRIGEAILQRVATVLYPLKAKSVGVPALRAAIVLGTAEGNGSLSVIRFFRAYPTQELQVSVPALLNLMGKASSISELVRFFSESPLDGLRGDTAGKSAVPP